MVRNIAKLSRDPFFVDAGEGGWYFIEPRSGDLKWGSALMRASKGLAFSLTPEPGGQLLRLQYADIVIDIGWTENAVDAANWVAAVNGFLVTKRDAAPPNGRIAPQAPTESAIG
jgi:hypothetical protein